MAQEAIMQFRSVTMTWFSGNYGSIIQAFALQQKLLNLGIDNEIINYVPDKKEKIRFFINSTARVVLVKNKLDARKIQRYYLTSFEQEKKAVLFENFEKKYLKLTKVFPSQESLEKICSLYDAYICGSDQIWNPGYYKGCNYLDFVDPEKRKIAYAPSIGISYLTDSMRHKIKPLLREFDYISLREEKGVELIAPLVYIPVTVVCDPVFLLTKDKWKSVLKIREIKEKYILCYFLGDNDYYSSYSDMISKKMNLPMKSIPTNVWGYENCQGLMKEVGPLEWVELIANAEFVLTDSFHATALSIIFNVSFLSLTRFKDSVKSSQNSRIYHILNIAELKDRLVNHDHDYKNLTISEDRWRITNEKIEAYREKSIDWLKNALHGFID